MALLDELKKLSQEGQPTSMDSMFKENDMNQMMSRLRDTVDRMLKGEIERFKEEMKAEMAQHMEAKGKDMAMRMPKPKDGMPGMAGMDGKHGKDGSPDKPSEIKSKLESLKGEERLDASAIKNLPQSRTSSGGRGGGMTLVQDDLSAQCDGSTRTFTTAQKIGTAISVVSTQFPTILRPTVDYSAAGTTLTLDSALTPPASGQTLIFVYSIG